MMNSLLSLFNDASYTPETRSIIDIFFLTCLALLVATNLITMIYDMVVSSLEGRRMKRLLDLKTKRDVNKAAKKSKNVD